MPDRAADLAAGKAVFDSRCAICHGADGLGLRATVDPADGYVFPPLWGPDSFNDGAGMHRVLTAARFVKARMPLGNADLTTSRPSTWRLTSTRSRGRRWRTSTATIPI